MLLKKYRLLCIIAITVIVVLTIIVLKNKFYFFSNDNRKHKQKLRIVHYNTEYLFSDSTIIDCPGKDCTWKNETQFNKHFTKISKIIKELNPDIINLCEINSSEVLNKLVNSLNDNSYNYYLSKSEPNYRDQSLGIITRIQPLQVYRTDISHKYPIENSTCNGSISGKLNLQKHIISKFFINNMNIIIIGVHLKANPDCSNKCSIREAQAMIIQKLILEYYNNYEIIVMGDLNDFDDDVIDHLNNIPNSKVLDIIKGEFGYNPINYKLYNVSYFLHKTERFTSNLTSMIDHILVTKRLKDNISDVDIFTEYIGKIGEHYNSDHYPIVVDFEFTRN
jgi:exonuclease III